MICPVHVESAHLTGSRGTIASSSYRTGSSSSDSTGILPAAALGQSWKARRRHRRCALPAVREGVWGLGAQQVAHRLDEDHEDQERPGMHRSVGGQRNPQRANRRGQPPRSRASRSSRRGAGGSARRPRDHRGGGQGTGPSRGTRSTPPERLPAGEASPPASRPSNHDAESRVMDDDGRHA